MKKVYKEIGNKCNTIRIFDYDNNTFTMYHTSKNIGFPFGIPQHELITDMGYTSLDDAIKQLTHRGHINKYQLIDYGIQRENEKIAYIQLGVERIKRNNRVNTNDFIDVIEKLQSYGLGFCDAQNQIIGLYEYQIGA